MRFGWFLGVACALLLHLGIILFGGRLFSGHQKDHGSLQQVELLSEQEAEAEKEKQEEEERQPEESEEMASEDEPPPDAAEVIRNLEAPSMNNAPKLEAASLSAIEAALNGQGGAGGDFAESLSFASGGRIGGTGSVGAKTMDLDNAFSLAEIDQKPRVIFQAAPVYPSNLKSVEGVVTLLFIVDESGKVTNARVEKSTHPDFEKPALDAVRQWKFEPAIKGGKRVSCKMKAPIRFQGKQ